MVSANNILLVEQVNTTTVSIAYLSGKITSITHAAAPAGSEAQRDAIQNAIVAALQTPWQEVVYATTLPYAVSAIVVA